MIKTETRICKNCNNKFDMPNPNWHNWFFCSAACCLVKQQQIKEQEQRDRWREEDYER